MASLKESKNLILVSFHPGQSGHAIGNLINMSDSIDGSYSTDIGYEGDAGWLGILETETFETVRPTAMGGKKISLELSIFDLPSKYRHQRNPAVVREAGLKKLDDISIGDSLVCCVTHARPDVARDVFRNAKIIMVIDADLHFSIRAQYEKKFKTGGHAKKIIDGKADPNQSFNPQNSPAAYMKEYIRWHHRVSASRTNILGLDSNILEIDRDVLLSRNWKAEYHRICVFLGIHPAYDLVEEYIDLYIGRQWRRPVLC